MILSLKTIRALLVVAATLYPLWGIFFHHLFGAQYDPYWQRFAISILSLVVLGFTYLPSGRKNAEILFHAVLFTLTAHYFFLVFRNDIAPVYRGGAFVTITAVSICFDQRKAFLGYAAFTLFFSFVLAVTFKGGQSWFLFAGQATILFVQYLMLSRRLSLIFELETSKRKFEVVFNSAFDGLLLMQDHQVLVSNQKLNELFENTTEEIATILSNSTRSELEIVTPKGNHKIIETASKRITIADRDATLSMARDVTEKRKTELHLQRTEQLATVGTLAAGVAHEINNPLSTIILCLEQASEGCSDPRVRSPLVQGAIAAERIRTIVKNLRVYSRDENQNPLSPVSLATVVKQASSLLGHWKPQGFVIIDEVGAEMVVLGVANWIEQVLINLIQNAFQAYPSNQNGERKVTLRAHERNDNIVLQVIDEGGGIPPHVRSKMFSPFFTTKKVGEGTGLGLYICLGMMKKMQGDIVVHSEVGKGTKVELYFQKSPTDVKAIVCESPPPRRSIDKFPPRALRILLVDDERDLVEALGAALRARSNSGHSLTIVTASTGRQALEILRTQERFDVVISDLTMPDMNGQALWEELKNKQDEVINRLLFMTGGACDPKSANFMKDHPDNFILKPFKASDLVSRINQIAGDGGRRRF